MILLKIDFIILVFIKNIVSFPIKSFYSILFNYNEIYLYIFHIVAKTFLIPAIFRRLTFFPSVEGRHDRDSYYYGNLGWIFFYNTLRFDVLDIWLKFIAFFYRHENLNAMFVFLISRRSAYYSVAVRRNRWNCGEM